MKWKCTTSLLSVPVAAAVMWMGMDVTSVATAAGQSATKQSIPVQAGQSSALKRGQSVDTIIPIDQPEGPASPQLATFLTRSARQANLGGVAGGLIEQVVVDGATVGPLQGGQQQVIQVNLAANPDPVIGFRIEADVSGITGNGTWASDMQLRITPPGGVGTYQIGGVPEADGGTLTNEWIFQGDVSDEDGFYSDTLVNIWNEISKGGTWRFTFRNDWPASTADMVWDNIVITLLKGETVVVECPIGGIDEPGECTDGLPIGDDPNGGCNANPAVFTQIQCGDTICGDIWASDVTATRDVDWYEVTVGSSQSLTWTVTAEFPSTAFIVNGDCGNAVGVGAIEQPFVEYDVTACVEPGTYYLIVTTNAIFEGITCDGLGDYGNAYTATLSCGACDASQFGACCFGETSSCDDGRTEIGCAVDGGVYAGDESLCSDPETCPEGACCTLGTFESAPQCSVVAAEQCALEGGFYQGDNTTCDADPETGLPACPRGACCFGDGTCGFGSVQLCIQSGGAYNGHFAEDGGPSCPGDCDNNGTVNVQDLLNMLAVFGPCEDCCEDLDGNGTVNVQDLLALLAVFGPCPQGGGAGACAEVDCRDCGAGGAMFASTDPCDELVGEGTNGGCNFNPPVFEQLCCGDEVTGTIWSQLEDPNGTWGPDNTGRRDLDWYVLEVTSHQRLYLNLLHDFGNQLDSSGNPIQGQLFLAQATCPPVIISAKVDGDDFASFGRTVLVEDVSPGSYYVVVSAALPFVTGEGFDPALNCDSGNNGYSLEVNCLDLIPNLCASGNCGTIQSHPGFPEDICSCDGNLCDPVPTVPDVDPGSIQCCPDLCDDCEVEGYTQCLVGDCQYDDGSTENAVNWTTGGVVAWVHRYDNTCSDLIHNIATTYGIGGGGDAGVSAGDQVGYAILADDGTGLPGDVLFQGVGLVEGAAINNDFNFQILEVDPPVAVPASFFITVWVEVPPGVFPAPMDTTSAAGNEDNVFLWGAPGGVFADFDPATAGAPLNIAGAGLPTVFMLRANQAVAP